MQANNVHAGDAEVLPAVVEIVEHSGEAAGLIACIEGAEQVLLVDACVSGARPGTVHRFDMWSDPMPALYSTHGFGLAAAVELARALGQLPRRCIVYAIEGASFGAGAPLSPPASAAVDEVVRRLSDEIAGDAACRSATIEGPSYVPHLPERTSS